MPETIATIMQTDFETLRPDQTIRDAVARLVRANQSAAPVLDDAGALAGILSQKDCFRSALSAGYYQQWTGTVADHMTASVRTLDADTDMMTAAEAFLAEPYRLYPVMRNDRPAGILTRADLLGAFLRHG